MQTGDAAVSYNEQAKEIAVKQDWITVSLIQRKLRLSYGYTLSLIDTLHHKGIVGRADATGIHPLITSPPAQKNKMQIHDTVVITKENIPSLALQVLDGLLDKTGRILYSSHETIRPGKIYLVGLNPGGSGGPSLR